MRRGASLVFACLTLLAFVAPTTAKSTTYADLKPADQVAFLERETARATAALAEDGVPVPVSAAGLLLVKRELDDYVARIDSAEARPGRERLGAVLDRAAQYAPGIARTFKSEGVPASLGVYVAFVESEYNPCLTSSLGAKGVFQFLPATAARFGLAADDLCDAEKSAVAAARYLQTLRSQFGTSGRGALLAVVAYNQGEKSVASTLANEQDLWAALARTPNAEGTRYLARILAATIVGENPTAFGLQGRPLSER
jgi:soluble lytic murein transglycosylase-like protein